MLQTSTSNLLSMEASSLFSVEGMVFVVTGGGSGIVLPDIRPGLDL
jgi:hypothetical protein